MIYLKTYEATFSKGVTNEISCLFDMWNLLSKSLGLEGCIKSQHRGGKETNFYWQFMLQVKEPHSQNKTLIKKRRDIWEKMMRENLLYHFIDFNCAESVSRKSDYNVDKEEWEYFYGMADGSKECNLNHKGKIEDVVFKHNDVYPDLADDVFVLFEGGKKAYHQINFFTSFLIFGEITNELKNLSDSVPIEKDANKFGI